MAGYDLIVLNGLVVTAEETREFDIAVKDGKIAKLVPRGALADVTAKKSIDAEGGMVMVCTSFREKYHQFMKFADSLNSLVE